MSVETGLTMVPAITSHGSSHAPNPTVGSKRKRGSPDGDGSHLERQATENHLSKRQSLGTSASRSGAFADPSPDDFSSHQPRDLFPPSDNQDSFLGSHVLSDSMPNYFNPEYANGGHDRMPMATAPHAPMTGAPNSASIPSPTSHSPYPGMNEVARLQGFNPSDRPLASNQFSDHQGELSTDFPVLDPGSLEKPSPGSSEWHRLRKDNHKEGKKRKCI